VVTGGGRGIGRLVAQALADAGYQLGLVARSGDELADTARLIQTSGGIAATATADVSDHHAADQGMRHLRQQLGPIDLLVNNAGILGPIGPAWEVDPQAWWRTMEVNLLGTLLFTRLALPDMIARHHGRIINISSQAGAYRWPVVSGYSVSKAAVIKLTENLALETRRHGISIFSVHPGLLPIGMSETAINPHARPDTNEGRIYAWAQHQLNHGQGAQPACAVEQILRLATGKYDDLTGRHLSVHDNLDHILAQIDNVRQHHLYLLALHALAA
jgi:NAD(P)-dependent dehydrogenase (short-subunit alcohol dehydrogenase family)